LPPTPEYPANTLTDTLLLLNYPKKYQQKVSTIFVVKNKNYGNKILKKF
jgi:hypothetical protein